MIETTTAQPRRQPPDVRREQILDAAEQVLLANGLASTTVADVAVAAGVAKGTVYLYFDSKAEILSGLRARHLERFAETVAQQQGRHREPSAISAIDAFVGALFEFAVGTQELHHLLFHEAGFSEADAFSAARATLGAIVQAGVDDNEFDVVDGDLTTAFLFDGIHGALVAALHSDPPNRRRFVHATRELTRRVLGVTAD